MAQEAYDELLTKLKEVADIEAAISVLHWDQSTYIPPKGNAARGRQMATLSKLAHEKFSDPSVGKLLDKLASFEEEKGPDQFEGALLRYTRRHYERAIKIPAEFMGRFSDHCSKIYDAWTRARQDNDFSSVQPLLEESLRLTREFSNYFPGYDHIADPLIEESDYGMKAASIQKLFSELKEELVPFFDKLLKRPEPTTDFLNTFLPADAQLAFGKKVIQSLGYDFSRGRQDLTHHPFMTKFALDDVRITTRVRENDFSEALFSSIHEAGHAMYEQGVKREFDGSFLCHGTSAGVHESQSRLWENIVGRSLSFWKYFFPKLQKHFPNPFENVSLNDFYKAINKVSQGLIRTDADEVSYSLHVMVRFSLEKDLLESKLSVAQLPKIWNERYEEYLGVRPNDDKDGVLQDVHWYSGPIGGQFQGYSIGNIFSAQSFAAATAALPSIPQEIEKGEFDGLRNWLTNNIYQYGSQYTAPEIIKKSTGGDLSIRPYIDYLKEKFGKLYEV